MPNEHSVKNVAWPLPPLLLPQAAMLERLVNGSWLKLISERGRMRVALLREEAAAAELLSRPGGDTAKDHQVQLG